MVLAIDILSWLLILVGGAFMVIGAIGVMRLPDFYTRLHAAGITDTMAATFTVAGLMLQGGLSLTTLKLGLMLLLIYLTSPTATHALANAAFHAGLRPDRKPAGHEGADASSNG